jgi:formate dehydrogenase maturation protein FdhE
MKKNYMKKYNLIKHALLTFKNMREKAHREILGLQELTCPKCGSQNIMSLRGEIIAGKHTIHECKCNICECDFLVSSNVIKK